MDARLIGFLGYRLDTVTRQLHAPGGGDVPLAGRAFEVLAYLIEHRDRVVGRDELLSKVWSGRVVEENNLTQAIAALRRSFGSDAGDHRFILTVLGRGYRFVAPLEEESPIAIGSPGTPMPTRRWWLAALAGAVSLAAVLGILAMEKDAPKESPAPIPANHRALPHKLVVLPFRSIGTADRDLMLELGMAETLITRLSRATGLDVLSLGSVQPFAGQSFDPMATARALGADYLLDGSTQRNGDLMRVNARLLSLRDGRSLWSGTFDASPDRVFTLQDALAIGVSGALSLQHPGAAGYRSPCDGEDAAAYRAYLRGRHLMFRPDAVRLPKAIAAFDEALVLDPGCARAWAGKAFAYRSFAMAGDVDPRMAFPQARNAVRHALRIDPASAEAYATKGVIEFWYDWDWAAAETSLRHAISLDANLAEAHYALAHLLHNIGRNDEGLPHAQRAAMLNPLSPIINTIVASFYVTAGRDDEARKRLDAVLDLDPDFWTALFWRANLEARKGNLTGAIADMQRANFACARCSHALAGLAWLQAKAGNSAQANELLREMQGRDTRGYFPATRLALAHEALGQRTRALDMLERAHAERDLYLTFLLVDQRLRPLVPEPRFQALLGRLRLDDGSGSTATAPR